MSEPQTQAKMRRSHRKTRTGCSQCKQRRVKCDERKPSCSNCTKRSTQCSLQFNVPQLPYSYANQPLKPATATEANGSLSTSHSPSSAATSPFQHHESPQTPSPAPTLFTLEDMQLLHHFIVCTAETFTEHLEHHDMWRKAAPSIAFEHPPLMHSLLALSAIHRAHMEPSKRQRQQYVMVATSHQNMAVAAYRPTLLDITRENCHSIFLFSALLVYWALASQHDLQGSAPLEHATARINFSDDDPSEWIRLMRGCPSILFTNAGQVFEWVANGPLHPFFHPRLDVSEDLPLPPELAPRFQALRAALVDPGPAASVATTGSGAPDPDAATCERAAYAHALHELQRYSVFLWQQTQASAQPRIVLERLDQIRMSWPASVDDEYAEYLRAKRPGALVLLAQYAVLVKPLNKFWWVRGLDRALVSVVWRLLPLEWRGWVEEPARMVGAWRDGGVVV
ncbi:uncharacterized protein K452DRAFT_354861 [Aplosporella prunicola CBS 121167]|uniref:Zn(2)-C6 fungal-type domain-containing protein n=1 Tax=Aplosporella prunicola CBS 121167 TaxID=1176127 RepID=A0A6A6BU12_9PEZI|nr:uncharacterized protein K452DRAFT_354861 [Aplosporella prunicola CBS 121167]KAF2147490.1 hypothetical protein K452DRAFT_354861 [Aplosporella prunicola CBS 121167]